MTLWKYGSRDWARRAWPAWYRSAVRSRLAPVKRVAHMTKRHLQGILTAIGHGVTKARTESINAGVQWLKYQYLCSTTSRASVTPVTATSVAPNLCPNGFVR